MEIHDMNWEDLLRESRPETLDGSLSRDAEEVISIMTPFKEWRRSYEKELEDMMKQHQPLLRLLCLYAIEEIIGFSTISKILERGRPAGSNLQEDTEAKEFMKKLADASAALARIALEHGIFTGSQHPELK